MKKKEIKLVVILSIVYFFCQISQSDLSAVFVDLIPTEQALTEIVEELGGN